MQRKFQELFQVMELASIAALVYDERGIIIHANRSFEKAFRIPLSKLLQKPLFEFIHPDDRDDVVDAINKALLGERVEPFRMRFKGEDGNYRTVQVFSTKISEKLGVAALSDVTDLEEQKLMLRLITRALMHDVLNALTAAINWIETGKELCKSCENSDYMEKLETAIERAVKIIKNLGEFEDAVIKGRLEKVNLREVIEDVSRSFSLSIIIEGNCEVFADSGVRLIFENLFQNAIQHGKTDKIEVIMKREGEFCEIRVADYGRGIPDEIKSRIFEEGFSYGENASSGVGLYIVRKLVERYGGEIVVEDNKPKGAVFVLRLRSCDKT